jgi:sterol desaturase/sphingolipid hydroxylase (fatty acid hydroxylase superfamily)
MLGERILRIASVPVVLILTIGFALSSLPRWGAPLTLVTVTLASVVAVALLERLIPFEPQWQRSHGDVQTDLLHNLLSTTISPVLWQLLMRWALTPLAVTLAKLYGAELWPSHWTLFTQLVLALVIGEFAQYWAHRLSHEREWLWSWHAVHHSAPRLYWLNAGRDHPLGVLLLYGATLTPLLLLGCPADVLVLQNVATAVLGLLQHANADYRLGPFNYVFSLAELHRFHHDKDTAIAHCNYGSNLSVWDLVFGTFSWPRRRPAVAVGIQGDPVPQTFLAQIAWPFQRGR